MPKITIRSVTGPITKNKKDGSGTFDKYVVEDTTGAKYDTFDSNILAVKPGAILEVEIKAKGRFMDLASWSMITPGTGPAAGTTAPQPDKHTDDRSCSIEAQCAIKAVIELRCADKLDAVHPLFLKAMDWLDAKIPDLRKVATPKPAEKPVDFDKDLGRSPEEKAHPDFISGTELVNYALKKGIKLDEIKVKLSINKPTEITDVKAATKILFP